MALTTIFNPFTNNLQFVNSSSGTTINFADNETPSGSGTSFTLAHSPSPATSLNLYRGGALQQAGGGDYTLSGNTITLNISLSASDILLASYRY